MEFLAVYPIILGYCQKAFRGCIDREELTAEAVAAAKTRSEASRQW